MKLPKYLVIFLREIVKGKKKRYLILKKCKYKTIFIKLLRKCKYLKYSCTSKKVIRISRFFIESIKGRKKGYFLLKNINNRTFLFASDKVSSFSLEKLLKIEKNTFF